MLDYIRQRDAEKATLLEWLDVLKELERTRGWKVFIERAAQAERDAYNQFLATDDQQRASRLAGRAGAYNDQRLWLERELEGVRQALQALSQ